MACLIESSCFIEFTQVVHGYLGGKRIPLPGFAYHAIRTEFLVNNEEFVGFEQNE